MAYYIAFRFPATAVLTMSRGDRGTVERATGGAAPPKSLPPTGFWVSPCSLTPINKNDLHDECQSVSCSQNELVAGRHDKTRVQ